MNSSAYDTLALARDLGVKLGVDTSEAQGPPQIIAKPKERITDELRAGIKANRDDLIRGLLFEVALRWLGERDAWGKLYGPEYERLQVVEDGTLEEYREVLRVWARAGLANAKEGAVA